jgi:hypothetical protein
MRPGRQFSKGALIKTTERLLIERHALTHERQRMRARILSAVATSAAVSFIAGLALGWFLW